MSKIDFLSFCISRSSRTSLQTLATRIRGTYVHSCMPSTFSVPDYVKLYLNKGGKFIADRFRCSISHVYHSLDNLERRLHIAKFFEALDSTERPKPSNLSRASRSSGSTWVPPENEAVCRFVRRVKRTLCARYVDRQPSRNLTWLDTKARQSLKKHRRSMIIVDADKGLGDVMMPRQWVEDEMQRLLDTGFRKLSREEYVGKAFQARSTLELVAERAKQAGVLTSREVHLITQNLFTAGEGSFRLRVKLHKVPLKGRPIANLSHSWLTSASLYLCDQLMPIQQSLDFAIASSNEFLRRMPIQVPCNYEIATIDIQNLYPSINTDDLIKSVQHSVRLHYGENQKSKFICQLLEILLRNQYVTHRGECYEAFGVATGIPPGVFLANLYVGQADRIVYNTHRDDIAFYARLVDDSVVCAACVDDVHNTLSSWKPELKWDITSRGGRLQHGDHAVAFLDLQLSHIDGRMEWQTHRKELNSYLYVPAASCHPKSVYASTIRGEVCRLLRTNSSKINLIKHLRFFATRLAMRGHSYMDVWRSIQLCLRNGRRKTPEIKKLKKFFMFIKYSRSVPSHVINSCLKKHASDLQRCFKDPISLSLAYTVQPNVFKHHFVDNWLMPSRDQ